MTDHCALTARVAETAGLANHGFVLSQTAAVADPSAESNAETVRALRGSAASVCRTWDGRRTRSGC
jgi:hypothetical protein